MTGIRPAPATDGVPSLASGAPSVAFAESPRPEGATVVRVADFDGPLGLLLALIEQRRLDVLTVPLGGLAEAYLDALATLEADRMGNIAMFVAVAGQLIVIKSRALLPRTPRPPEAGAEESDPEEDLRRRLLVFRAYRDASRALGAMAASGARMFRREPVAASAAGIAGARPAPAEPLDPAVLAAALDGLFRIVPPEPGPPAVMGRTITLADRVAIIRTALRDAPMIVLQDLVAGARDRVVVAVTFLALLELVKRREVTAEQAEPWGPIVVRRREREDR
ncbi:MAG: segregation/condensation protein A [Chloroflexi bacterium]|nr:segregation/condensation protein A [Chloroflexota bacterium]